ncbi:MAG: hypothetical protein PHY54_03835 [Methylococcales bacterium]|nr:hypothetical protein [Methylococcales bacterium]
MKRIILTNVLLLMGVIGEAMAACAVDVNNSCYTQVTNLAGLLTGNTVCDGSSGNWKGQEWHSGSAGELIDYKHGPSSTNDPSAKIGEWSAAGGTVTYGYFKDTNNPAAGTATYSYTVWQKADGTYDFCNGGALVTNVTIQTGQGACTGSSTPIVCTASASSSANISPTPVLSGSPAGDVSPTKENKIKVEQEKQIEPLPKDDDKQGKQAKPIAFPGPKLPPAKEGDKQGEKDKSIVIPAKGGDKQGEKDKSIVIPAKEGNKQSKPDN